MIQRIFQLTHSSKVLYLFVEGFRYEIILWGSLSNSEIHPPTTETSGFSSNTF